MESLVAGLSRVRVVVVEPAYDGNLGQLARAMSNFGLTRLHLVGGSADPDSDEARWYARDEALKVLEGVRRHGSLLEAVADCRMVIATSRRLGRRRGPVQTPGELFEELAPWRAPWETAIVFGREAHGLSTAELDLCQRVIWIPTDPAHPSMNLAHSVAVVGYALATAARAGDYGRVDEEQSEPADRESVEAMFQHARRVWVRIGYLHYQNPDAILRAWRKLFARTGLTGRDLRVIRALLHQTEWVAKVAGIPPGGPEEAPEGMFDKHGERRRERREG
ncbi:MAG: TrmH family RNA methyltransferase [Acidobacteriota bacterium]|nr:TrmH family RNA methyltransferase [Acidobacteriota bacterium]MDQ7087906.1 TrmH family RNA methyltransferase [Acidobacteriota bacterium]